MAEGHLRPAHVQLLRAMPPKYAVAQGVGSLKGQSAIYLARTCGGKVRNLVGEQCWARGSVVATVGRAEKGRRDYLQHQEAAEKRLEQWESFQKKEEPPWEAAELTALSGSQTKACGFAGGYLRVPGMFGS